MKAARLLGLLLALLPAAPAWAQWQTFAFDLSRSDPNVWTTDLPAGAFGAGGIKLELKGGESYSLTSQRTFSGDFDFELQVDVPRRNEQGNIQVDLVLINNARQRKVVATYTNRSLKPGSDGGTIRYYKDGKAQGFMWGQNWRDFSQNAGYGNGTFEWLRLHKEDKRVWFMARLKGVAYDWAALADYPKTSYFQEDCDEFQVGLVVRADSEASGTLNIKTMQMRGDTVLPRDPSRREFHFDFGPVTQELEDEFSPVSEYSMYSKEKGYGWVIPEMEKVWRGPVPALNDAQIAQVGLPAVRHQKEDDWKAGFLTEAYWMEANDKKLFYSVSHGGDYIEFYKQWLDLKTPLERDMVAMAKPYHFQIDPQAIKDTEERRGSMYIDDDLSAEFVVDLPNGNYNVILGVGFTAGLFGGGEATTYNMEINGKVRKQGLGPNWRRPNQFPVRNILVENGQMRFRLFCNVRQAMDKFYNHDIGVGWMINYLLILPAEQKELMNQWEWKIIKRRGEIIRRVTFVKGEPVTTKNEGNFISLNGKPWYFLKTMNNYHPGVTEHFPYYCLTNDISAFHATQGSQHFFKPDWEKLSYSDDYPWDTVDRLNVTFTWGMLATLHQDTILSFVPHAVSGEGNPTMDSRGRTNRYNIQPPLNSALGKEIQKEAYTMMANQLADHPGQAGHFVYEELWHPEDAGYDDQSLIQYWDWLKRKYGTIEALNKEWGREYASFEDIVQPKDGKEFWQFTPEFANFRKFRGWAQREMVKSAYELIKKNEPGHFAWGAKGDFGTQSFYTGPMLDMFGWYDPSVAGSVARYFGKAAIAGGYQLNCEYAYLDGRKQVDHKPGVRRYIGRDESATIHNKIISSVFKGAKGFFNEWYSDGMSHIFHRTTMIADKGPKGQVVHWTGQLAFYEPEAYVGPPVNIDRGPLLASSANQLLYRLGHLWLPAKPLVPKVLIPTVEESFWLDFMSPKPYADFEEMMYRPLRSSNLPVDFLAMEAVADLSQYQLIVLGDVSQAISLRDAERLKEFVAKGGKLVLMNAGAMSSDERPRRWDKEGVYPLEAFTEMGGYRLVSSNRWHMPLGKVTASFADGRTLGEWETNFYYEAGEGSQVFLKGSLALKDGGTREVALGIVNKAGNVVVCAFPPKEAKEESVRPLSQWFGKQIDSWRIDGRVTMAGIDDAWNLYAGCLQGEGYVLATVCNSEGQSRKLSLQLRGLAAGEYAVIDVTGEAPELTQVADGGRRLKPDAAAREMKVGQTLSEKQLAEAGIACEVPAGQAKVFLIRPTGQKTWVSIWPGVLRSFQLHPITIGYGRASEDRAGAEAIAAAVSRYGVKASVMPAEQVKRKTLKHEVRINAERIEKQYHEDTSKWYLVDAFNNEVIDTDQSVILVGSESTNALIKHLAQPGTFVYDKVLEKVTSSYPGPGRGTIGFVDAVNAAIYDVNSHARDAILVGGSDAAGTQAAVAELVKLMEQNPPTPPATRPVRLGQEEE